MKEPDILMNRTDYIAYLMREKGMNKLMAELQTAWELSLNKKPGELFGIKAEKVKNENK